MNQTPTKISHRNRNIAIAVVVILVLIIASVATIYFARQSQTSTSTATLPKFNMSLSSSNGTVIQGSGIHTSITVSNFTGSPENVTLSAYSNSSEIQSTFDPATSTSNFTSTLTMRVPNSTPTGNYSVIVTASSGEVTQNASYMVSVLSANVTVSGWVYTTISGKGVFFNRLVNIEFVDMQTNSMTSFAFSGTGGDEFYSVTLVNKHTYEVTVNYSWGSSFPGTFNGGNLYVYASVGYTAMSQDYS